MASSTIVPSSLIFRPMASLLSPAGAGARLSILNYHRVLPAMDPLLPNEVTAEVFDSQLALLKRVFDVLPLAEAIERLKRGELPARAAAITFDDGYANNATVALPILQKHGLHATFFVASAFLDGGRMFNDTVIEAIRLGELAEADLQDLGLGRLDLSTPEARVAAIDRILPQVKYLPEEQREGRVRALAARLTERPLPDDLMLDTAQLKALQAAGMEIGSHTHRHPILAMLDAEAARAEIGAGLDWLEQALGRRPRLFAYPNGKPGRDYLPAQARLLAEMGLLGAVTTQCGASGQRSDPYQLARCPTGRDGPARFMALLLNNLRLNAPTGVPG